MADEKKRSDRLKLETTKENDVQTPQLDAETQFSKNSSSMADFLQKRVKPFFTTFHRVSSPADDKKDPWVPLANHKIRESCLRGYTLREELGHGRFGTVYGATDTNDNICVVKVIVPYAHEDIVQFNREILATRRISVLGLGPRVLDAWVCLTSRKLWIGFIAMDLVPGISLVRFQDTHYSHHESYRMDRALDQLKEDWQKHEHEWVHDDLHGNNILVEEITDEKTGSPKNIARAIDFGKMVYKGDDPTYIPVEGSDESDVYQQLHNDKSSIQLVDQSLFESHVTHDPHTKEVSLVWYLTTRNAFLYDVASESELTKNVREHYDGYSEQPVVQVMARFSNESVVITKYMTLWDESDTVRNTGTLTEMKFLFRLAPKSLCYLIRLGIALGYVTQKQTPVYLTRPTLFERTPITDLADMKFQPFKNETNQWVTDVKSILRWCRPFPFFH